MKTWREQAEQAGASIKVEGSHVTVLHPATNMMVRDIVGIAGVEQTIEGCCKMLVKHIETL